MNKSFDNQIDTYKECAKIHFEIDYSNKKSVKRANKAVVEMIRIAQRINIDFPQKMDEFSELLNEKKYRLDIWVAHHLLERMNYTKDMEEKAIAVIEEYAKEDSADGLGNRMWLSEWRKKNEKV
ncbi:galactokinase [Paenibacillus castaneae]|uniref:hypothetical protein n=1 Tax=Paenibacillus castaneae TaxID=474957 RepID=UPI000C9B44E9|nr:hypothetical protein [Paenibacillus castaneae]NIK80454.1 galactokinase [Paenibacillus castaneae]